MISLLFDLHNNGALTASLSFLYSLHMYVFLLVEQGGLLFEYYILLHGLSSDAKQLTHAIENKMFCDEDTVEYLHQKYALQFWYDSIRIMQQVNQKCSQPLMLWHMLLEYRGLSHIGQRIGAAVSANLPVRTYCRKKKAMIAEYEEKLKEMLINNHAVLTMDNFCKSYGNPTLSMNRTTQYINTNFTVNALCAILDPPVEGFPLRLIAGTEDTYVPSIPMHLKELADFGDEVDCLLPFSNLYLF